MSVKQFLRMMPQIDRRYLDEAYRVTAGRTTAKERGGIVKKVTKIAVAAAVCVGVIAGGAALIYKLNNRLDVSPNPHGSGYVGNAPETVKFRAALTPLTEEDTRAKRTAVPGRRAFSEEHRYNSFETMAFSDTGYYYVGTPQPVTEVSDPPKVKSGICYTDKATGQSMYLCAKPECLHDGSDYCPATSAAYHFQRLLWYDGMLYAVAEYLDAPEKGISHSVLVRIQPDGTGMEEIAVLDDRGGLYNSEIIAYRGAVWVIGTVQAQLKAVNYDQMLASGPGADAWGFYTGIWHYDIARGTLTAVSEEPANSMQGVSNLQADGDSIYVYKYSDDIDREDYAVENVYTDPETLRLKEGILQIDAKTGVIKQHPVHAYLDNYTAVGGRLCWVEKTETDYFTDTGESYALHTLEGDAETTVRVPRANRYTTDGSYVLAELYGDVLMVCDMQGNVLRKEQYDEGRWTEDNPRSPDFFYRSASLENGVLYTVQFDMAAIPRTDGEGTVWNFTHTYLSAPIADYAAGKAELTEFLTTCRPEFPDD